MHIIDSVSHCPQHFSLPRTYQEWADIIMNLVSPCGWDPDFKIRRDLHLETENTPYVEWRAKLGSENSSDPGDDESVVRTFMMAQDESDVCTPRADKVEAFCAGTSLQSRWQG